MTRILVILFSLLFIGCTPAKRLARFEKRHPYLFSRKDSVKIKVIPALYTDTSKVFNKTDSLVITNRDVITKIFRHYDTVRVEQEFPETKDTIHYYHETTIQTASDDTWRLFGVFDAMHLTLMGVLLFIIVGLIIVTVVIKR